jgi:hypothetical protein
MFVDIKAGKWTMSVFKNRPRGATINRCRVNFIKIVCQTCVKFFQMIKLAKFSKVNGETPLVAKF